MSKSIETIEGIGSKTGASLRDAGVRTVEKLLETACTKKGRKELASASGISEKVLLSCVNMADLFRIHGVPANTPNCSWQPAWTRSRNCVTVMPTTWQ